MSGIVAIGGGQAGFSFVQKLRSLGCNQKITLVCGEDMVPYQRPPLSKKFFSRSSNSFMNAQGKTRK